MKKFRIGILGTFLSLSATVSCDDKLNLAPLGELSSETFYKTYQDFEGASLGPYSTMLNFYFEQNGLGHYNAIERPSDDSRHGGQGQDSNVDFIWLPNNGDFRHIYEESYKGIMRANAIISRIPASELEEADKARFEAEARFMRGHFYFILATQFGTPPLVKESITSLENTRIGNSSPGEILDFVEQDFQFAQDNLPAVWDDANVGRATSGAATAYLGKVYLYRQKYQEAVEEFDDVLQSQTYSLTTNYGDNFAESKENNAESIFEIQFSRGDVNPWLPVDFGLENNNDVGHAGTGRAINFRASCFLTACAPGANGQGYGRIHATQSLQDEFEPNDPRIFHTFFVEGEDYFGTPYNPAWSITGATPSKYLRDYVTYAQPNAGSNNERLIRLADVYLMLAEAELLGNNDVARAAELINLVRRRADPSGEILPDRPGDASADQMLEWLMHERRVELAFEGHRYNDLVRWHNAGLIDISTDVDFGSTLANQNWSPTHLLKPIPQREIDLVPELNQNPGY